MSNIKISELVNDNVNIVEIIRKNKELFTEQFDYFLNKNNKIKYLIKAKLIFLI